MNFKEIKDASEAAIVILSIQIKNKEIEIADLALKLEEQEGMLADANAWIESL
tara:strand:- start:26 stop:184 length:159 start_codon:yes stop_codon:yes gene_type:complete